MLVANSYDYPLRNPQPRRIVRNVRVQRTGCGSRVRRSDEAP
jgi:hypothetical protein